MKVIKKSNINTDWYFELSDIVTVNIELEGVNKGDKFEIIDRYTDSCSDELYSIERITDKVQFDDIGIFAIELLNDTEIEEVWDNMENVGFDEGSGEVGNLDMSLGEDYFIWKAGTDRFKIWQWFDKNHSKGVKYLHNEREG